MITFYQAFRHVFNPTIDNKYVCMNEKKCGIALLYVGNTKIQN